MALSNEVVRTNNQPTPTNGATAEAPSQAPVGATHFASYREASFRPALAGQTGAEIGTRARDRGTHAEGERELSTELHGRYTRFLKEHVEKLYNNPGLLDKLKTSPKHSYQHSLALALAKTNAQGEPIFLNETNRISGEVTKRMELDEAKLKSFFDPNSELGSQGWAITTQLLEQDTTYELFAQNLSAQMTPNGTRDRFPNGANLDTGRGAGPLAEAKQKIADWLKVRVPEVDGREGWLPRPIAVPLALTVLPITLAHEAIKPGVSIKLEEGIKSDRQESPRRNLTDVFVDAAVAPALPSRNELDYQYLKVMHDLDLNAPDQSTISANQERRQKLIGNLQTRYMFLESIGVPRNQIDALPIQRIVERASPEQTGTYWDIATNDAYRKLLAANPNADEIRRAQLFRQAGAEILDKQIQAYSANRDRIQIEREAKTKQEADKIEMVGYLDTQITTRESSTPVKKAQKIALERKQKLEEKKSKLGGRSEKAKSTNSLTEKRLARERAENELGRLEAKLKKLFTEADYPEDSLNAIPADSVKAVEVCLDAIDYSLEDSALTIGLSNLRKEKKDEIVTKKTEAETAIKNRFEVSLTRLRQEISDLATQANAAGITPNEKGRLMEELKTARLDLEREQSRRDKDVAEAKAAVVSEVDQDYIEKEAEIKGKLAELESAKEQLRTLRTTVEAARAEEREAQNEQRAGLKAELSQNKSAFERLNPNRPGEQLSLNQMATWSVDEIFGFITNPVNTAYNFTPGTYEEGLELKEQILRAKTEVMTSQMLEVTHPEITEVQEQGYLFVVRANQYGPDGGVTRPFAPIVDGGVDVSIKPEDLLRLSQNQLVARLKLYPAAVIRGMSDGELSNIVNDAMNLAVLRAEASEKVYVELATDLYDQETEKQQKLSEFDFSRELVQLKTAKSIALRQGEIFTDSAKIIPEIGKFSDTSILAATDTDYSEAERDMQAPKGYYELLQLLTNYQGNVLNREERFAEVSSYFTPAEFTAVMKEAMKGYNLVEPVDINVVLNRLNGIVTTDHKGELEIQQLMSRVIKLVVKRANALG